MISKNQILRKQTQNKPKQTQNKPNHKKAKNAPTSLLLTTNDQRLTTREAQNKPKQTQLSHRAHDFIDCGCCCCGVWFLLEFEFELFFEHVLEIVNVPDF